MATSALPQKGDLPAVDLKDTTIVIASEAQTKAMNHYAFLNWVRPRSDVDEETLGRFLKEDLVKDGLTRDGRMIHCFRRDAKVLPKGGEEIQNVQSYCITSVITPPQHRRNGYARRMLQSLHYCIALPSALPPWPKEEWGEPPAKEYLRNDATYATLWSDVGREFYKLAKIGGDKDGWVVNCDKDMLWDITDLPGDQKMGDEIELPQGWERVKWGDKLPESILHRYEQEFLETRGKELRKTVVLDSTTSPDILKYYLGRQFSPSVDPRIGEMIRNNVGIFNSKTGSVILYCPTETKGEKATFHIVALRLAKDDEASFDSLLDTLAAQAMAFGSEIIEAWEVPSQLVPVWEKRPQATLKTREEHLGAIAWYGSGPAEEVQWVAGEKFAWA